MSFNYVTIHYGPCHSFNDLAYKPERLAGLKDRLQKLGYRVDLNQVKFENYCLLEMCGHEIFRCNLKNLMFNTPYNLDPVCKRALEAVLEASSKFFRARSNLWFRALLLQRVFQLGDLSITDHFPKKSDWENLKPYAPVDKCQRECCGILTTKTVTYNK